MSEVEVRVPDIGDYADVPVIEILVKPGDTVAVEDPLVTLESDKATMDVPAPVAGTIKQLRVALGDKVAQGSVLLTLDAADAAPEAAAAAPAPASPAPAAAPPAPAAAPPAVAAGPSSSAGATRATAPRDAQVVVIGSGPGGYTAAFRAADLGLKTILIERYERLGGVCLNVGCIPSKALLHAARVIAEAEEMAEHGVSFGAPKVDLAKLLDFKTGVVSRLTGGLAGLAKQRKVEVVTGTAKFSGPNSVIIGDRTITFDNCIIAAGSSAVKLPSSLMTRA